MLRRYAKMALAVGGLLIGASSLYAQEPLYRPGTIETMGQPGQATASSPQAGTMMVDPAVIRASRNNGGDFDPIDSFNERVCRTRQQSFREKYGDRFTGRKGPYWTDECNFECANCYSRWDVEKRLFLAYNFLGAMGRATEGGIGDGHGAQVGVEILPWVLQDGSTCYSRWGATFMFAYASYNGNPDIDVQSRETGRFISIADGNSYSFMFGPTYRTDFDLFGIRMSPNATVGITFDWAQVKERAPRAQPRLGETPAGNPTGDVNTPVPGTINPDNSRQAFTDQNPDAIRVNRFKYSGFDAGGFIRLMWDFGITDNLNFGIGGEYRFIPSDVMMNDSEIRKHLNLVLQFSHTF